MTPQRLTIQIDESARALSLHLQNACALANHIASAPLGESAETLTAWLNSRHPSETEAMFAAHAGIGAALNAAREVLLATLSAWGVEMSIPEVDVRPVPEKLADRFKALEFDQATGLFSVARLPEPEPQPEPTPEP